MLGTVKLGMVKVVKGVNVGGVERQGMVNVFFILKRTSELVDVRVAQCWGNERHTICETITSYEFLDARASLAPTPVRLSVRSSYFRIPILSASLSLDDIVLADMVGDMMADMELDMVADKKIDIDININMEIQFCERAGQWSGGLVNWAKTFSTWVGLRIF